ncbi:hypothetical protein EG328_006314 [Venturia inaequalis]|uniref:Protein kinase domain-containing protein n=1 Tax=Venturia inaequalis TaxID=5025 RepID=A0A8H3YR37_VENIN|nr:hypothetical protein EG328_006314 [Venturia inaequalis]
MTTNHPLIRHIGGGVEGEITLIQHRTRGVVILKARKCTRHISNEANVTLSLLQTETIPKTTICQVFSIEGPTNDMIIEWCDGGDLRYIINNLHSKSYSLGKSFLRHVQLHLGSALLFIHCGIHFNLSTGKYKNAPLKNGQPWIRISHRDIKPDNVFLRWTSKADHSTPFPDLVLGDFGNAVTEHAFDSIFQNNTVPIEAPKWKKFCGQNYGPPEYFLLEGGDDHVHRFSILSSFDIWQFGATLYELLTRIVLNMVMQNQDRDGDKIGKWIGREEWGEVREEVMDMITEDPMARMTDEVLMRMVPFWRGRREEEFWCGDGVGGRDLEWLRGSSMRVSYDDDDDGDNGVEEL